MAEKIRATAAVSAIFYVVILFSGCKTGTEGVFEILNGVLAWSRQDWVLSASSFLETKGKATENGDTLLREYAVYGLASTYLSQDEYDSSLALLSEIDDSSVSEIRAGVLYQAGVIAFRKGEYSDAASFFRKSLENEPASLDAKINLEISNLSLVERRSDRAAGSSGIREDKTPSLDEETIFNLIRKKEQDRWKNQETETVNTSIADY